MNINLCSYRYFQDSLIELREWKEKKKYNKVIYPCPIQIKEQIDIGKHLFIVEMNNSTNKIEGFGCIKNKIYRDKRPKIHSNPRFNRKIYKGKHRIDQEEFTESERYYVDVLEDLIFSGKGHIKRGVGIQEVPEFVKNIRGYQKYTIPDKLDFKKIKPENILIKIDENNEKTKGSLSYKRYEDYKLASNKREFLEMGGTNVDFNHDLKKGYISIIDNDDNIIYNTRNNFDIINLDTIEFIKKMFTDRFNHFD